MRKAKKRGKKRQKRKKKLRKEKRQEGYGGGRKNIARVILVNTAVE